MSERDALCQIGDWANSNLPSPEYFLLDTSEKIDWEVRRLRGLAFCHTCRWKDGCASAGPTMPSGDKCLFLVDADHLELLAYAMRYAERMEEK